MKTRGHSPSGHSGQNRNHILSAPPASPPTFKSSGTLEIAQHIANYESPRTTKLYDRTSDEIMLDEVERIRFDRSHSSSS
jgi:hypothetical protein